MTVLLLEHFWQGVARNAHPARYAWAHDFAHTMDSNTFHRDREAAVLSKLDQLKDKDWGHLLVWAVQHEARQVQEAALAQPRAHWEESWADALRIKSWNLTRSEEACEAILDLWPAQHPDLSDHIIALLDRMSDDGEWLAMEMIMSAACRRNAVAPAQAWFAVLGAGRFPFAAREVAKALARQREEQAQARVPPAQSAARPRARS